MSRRTGAPRRPPHPFSQAEHPNWRGQPVCRCGQPTDATCHDMPDNPAAEVEARRLGEREDTDG